MHCQTYESMGIAATFTFYWSFILEILKNIDPVIKLSDMPLAKL